MSDLDLTISNEDIFGLRYTKEDLDKGYQIQKDYTARLLKQPVFASARATFDTAAATSSDYQQEQQQPLSRTAAKEAMEALKNNLNSIRSNKSNQNQGFTPVPVTHNETRIRGNIASDYINSSSSSSNNGGATKTSATIDVRPNNQASFEASREALLKGTDVTVENEDDASQKAQIVAKIKIDIDLTSHADANAILAEIEGCILGIGVLLSNELETTVAGKIVDVEGGKKQLHITFADYEAEDPLGEFFANASRKALGKKKGRRSRFDKETNTTPATDVLRLLTLHLESPHSIADWLTDDNQENRSVISLLEGARIAFETIIRDDSKHSIAEDLAKTLLDSFDKEDLVKKIVQLILLSLGREVNVDVKATPFEQLFATTVRDGGRALRAMLLEKFAEDSYRSREDAYISRMNETLQSTFPEEAIAALASYTIPIIGITPVTLQLSYFARIARSLIDNHDQAPITKLFTLAMKSKNVFDNVESVEVVTPSVTIDARFKGVGGRCLRGSKIPNDFKDMVQKFKPIARAGFEALDESKEAKKQKFLDKERDTEELERLRALNTPSLDLFPDGWWTAETQTQVTDLDHFQHSDLPLCKNSCDHKKPFKLYQRPVEFVEGKADSVWFFDDLPEHLTKFEKKEEVEEDDD